MLRLEGHLWAPEGLQGERRASLGPPLLSFRPQSPHVASINLRLLTLSLFSLLFSPLILTSQLSLASSLTDGIYGKIPPLASEHGTMNLLPKPRWKDVIFPDSSGRGCLLTASKCPQKPNKNCPRINSMGLSPFLRPLAGNLSPSRARAGGRRGKLEPRAME